MTDFGELRSAAHALDLRSIIEASYRKRRYRLTPDERHYIDAALPEYEREVLRWAYVLADTILERTSAPYAMVYDFAARWAEWMQSGAPGVMPWVLKHTSEPGVRLGWMASDTLASMGVIRLRHNLSLARWPEDYWSHTQKTAKSHQWFIQDEARP